MLALTIDQHKLLTIFCWLFALSYIEVAQAEKWYKLIPTIPVADMITKTHSDIDAMSIPEHLKSTLKQIYEDYLVKYEAIDGFIVLASEGDAAGTCACASTIMAHEAIKTGKFSYIGNIFLDDFPESNTDFSHTATIIQSRPSNGSELPQYFMVDNENIQTLDAAKKEAETWDFARWFILDAYTDDEDYFIFTSEKIDAIDAFKNIESRKVKAIKPLVYHGAAAVSRTYHMRIRSIISDYKKDTIGAEQLQAQFNRFEAFFELLSEHYYDLSKKSPHDIYGLFEACEKLFKASLIH